MRSTFRLMFYINRNKVKSDGTTAILCRISIDGRKSAVTTGIYCKPSDWDSNKGEIRMNKENNRLTAFRSRLEEAYGNLLKNQGVVTAELLKATVSNTVSIPEFLLQTGEAERERLRIRSVEINSTSTYRQSKTTQLNLRQFIESRGMRDIAFSDITEEFAESFKIFLKKELGHGNGHVNHCLCWLNRLIYIAVDREVLRANPIEDVAYEKKDSPKLKHIGRNELKLIMETPMPDPMMELARRTFIFSSFTGLAYVDTRRLHPRHIEKSSLGRRYIRIRRAKTGAEAFIPLHPVAEQILELYNTTDNEKPVFPLPVRDILYRNGLIKTNVNDFLDKIETEDVVKDYLSVDELYKLAETPCKKPVLKTASLFSCMTSLRISDILALCWEDIVDYSAGGKCVHIVTQKNRAEDIIPISEEALDLIGYSPDKRGMVFKGLQRCWTQTYMKEWIRSAGITKNISFHSYRRTFATLQAAAGTDIRTIQSIMAHKSITTTQRYIKVVDANKREASKKITLMRKK